jgi:hypothetical protein
MNDSNEILGKILDVIKETANERIAQINSDKGLSIEPIQEIDIGYKDILTGLRNYPALVLLEKRRVTDDYWFTQFNLLLGFAFKSGMPEQMLEFGQYYKDIIEWAIISDHTFGGVCLDSNNMTMEDAYTSDIYVISTEFTVTCDRRLADG